MTTIDSSALLAAGGVPERFDLAAELGCTQRKTRSGAVEFLLDGFLVGMCYVGPRSVMDALNEVPGPEEV